MSNAYEAPEFTPRMLRQRQGIAALSVRQGINCEYKSEMHTNIYMCLCVCVCVYVCVPNI